MKTSGTHSVVFNGYTYIVSFEPHENCTKYMYKDETGGLQFVYCNFDSRYSSNVFKDAFTKFKVAGIILIAASPLLSVIYCTINIYITLMSLTLLLFMGVLFFIVGCKNIKLADTIKNAVPIKEGVAMVICEYCNGTYDIYKSYESCPHCGAPITTEHIGNASVLNERS